MMDTSISPSTVVDRSILIANGKGGVGKTSIAANLAGIAARRGMRVLAIDLDPQGNLASDLGYRGSETGPGVVEHLLEGAPLAPLRDVRPGLDAMPGGPLLRDLADRLTAMRLSDPTAVTLIGYSLRAVASDYDLVVVDGPPSGGILVDSAMAMTGAVVVPVKSDEASIDGLELIARSFGYAREVHNPNLRLLGVVMFDLSLSATSVQSELRAALEDELGGLAPVFGSCIRRSERSAVDMRRWGLLAHEYRDRAAQALSATNIRERIEAHRLGKAVERFSRAADGLADDYEKLTTEILDLFFGGTP